MGQGLPGELGQEISGTALLSPRSVFDRHKDIVRDIESGAHASDANTTGGPAVRAPWVLDWEAVA
jgi:hypothetical protein